MREGFWAGGGRAFIAKKLDGEVEEALPVAGEKGAGPRALARTYTWHSAGQTGLLLFPVPDP